MKTIVYNGNSKIIKRIVALLNGKAPMPLDANNDVDWGTDGQVLATDGSGATKWVSGGSGSYTAGDGIKIASSVISLEYFSVVDGCVNITYTE